jgi:Fe-S cluster biogenesis protein NfuA
MTGLEVEVRDALRGELGEGMLLAGNRVELIGVDEDQVAQVRLIGACQGCPATMQTLVMGLDEIVRKKVPAIKFVELVP